MVVRNGIFIACVMCWSVLAWGAPPEASANFFEPAFAWLMSPISGAADHRISTGTSLHGRLMVLAWGILVPVAILLSRFYKVTPGQDWPRVLNNPFWFRTHRAVSYGAGVLMLAAVVLIVLDDPKFAPWRSFHAAAGWTLVTIGWMQLLGSHLRGATGGPSDPVTRAPLRMWEWRDVEAMGGPSEPFPRNPRLPQKWHGDHFSMTRRRILFEQVHKALGYVLLVFSAVTLVSGLLAADALKWMWITLALWWLGCVGVFVVLQRQGRCIDCYQAIWGVDENLPGNRFTPIGWGIRSYTRGNLAQAPWPRRRTNSRAA